MSNSTAMLDYEVKWKSNDELSYTKLKVDDFLITDVNGRSNVNEKVDANGLSEQTNKGTDWKNEMKNKED